MLGLLKIFAIFAIICTVSCSVFLEDKFENGNAYLFWSEFINGVLAAAAAVPHR